MSNNSTELKSKVADNIKTFLSKQTIKPIKSGVSILDMVKRLRERHKKNAK